MLGVLSGERIRCNIRTLEASVRERFAEALLTLQGRAHREPDRGPAADAAVDEEELRAELQMRRGPEFLLWHRKLCDRFEQMLRAVDPDLSLHYWNWNEDPYELFTAPLIKASRGDAPFEGLIYGTRWMPQDEEILEAETFDEMRRLLESKHDAAHFVYFGGAIVNAHISYHDPFAFLLHSNVDRLFAIWQSDPRHRWRLDPTRLCDPELLKWVLRQPGPLDVPRYDNSQVGGGCRR